MLDRKRQEQLKINSTFVVPQKKEDHSYVLLDKRFLHLGDNISFNLYFKNRPTQMSLFLQSDTVVDQAQKQRLQEVEQVFVSSTEYHKYEIFVEEHLQNLIQDTSLTLDEKTDIIYTSSTELTHSLYDNPEALENVQRSENIVMPILQSIIYNDDTIASYMKIIEHDYYTHTHSLNVSVYALCLGAALGLKEERLVPLGRAALLHDLGKSKISYEVINKNGVLTQEEFDEMKNHPSLGYEIAVKIGIKDKNILDGIRHHHEKLDGNGYPDNLKENEINLFPRIIGICDVFDALTTKRSYKDAMRSFNALQIMKLEMNAHLDMKILNVFIKMLHK
ncbi:MAG: HD domain-containing phosphohydrolase [Sulfurimonas sp.]